MRTIRKLLFLICLFGAVGYQLEVDAQSMDTSFDLKAALNYGLANSLSIRQASNDLRQTEYKIKEIKSSALPQISGEGQFQNFVNRPTQLLPGEIIGQPGTQIPVQFGTKYNVTGTLKASQLIYNQQLISGLKVAESSRELYRMLEIKTEEDVIYQISNAYYQCLELMAQRESLDSNLQKLEKLEKIIEIQVDQNMITRIDLNRIKVRKSNLTNQLNNLKTGMEQQYNYLKLLLGMPIQSKLELHEVEIQDTSSSRSMEIEKLKSIDLQILDKQKLVQSQNLKAIQAGYYPTLSVFGQQAWQGQRNEFNFFNGSQPWFQQTIWGINLQVPIFDGGEKRHKAQQARVETANLNIQILQAERQLDMVYENAKKQLVNSLEALQVQHENRELAKEVFEQTQILYQESVASLTDLLDSEQAYRDAEINYYQEFLKYKQAELDLLKSQGQLKTIL